MLLTFHTPPGGGDLVIDHDAYIQPASRAGASGRVSVMRGEGRLVTTEFDTFQLILFITMGDMVQQAVTQQDYSVTAGVLAVSVFAVITMALSWANSRWPRVRTFTHGVPVVIMENGEASSILLLRERISIDDLKAAARQQGIEKLSDVRLAGAGGQWTDLLLHPARGAVRRGGQTGGGVVMR